MLIASVWRFFNPVPVLFWFFDQLDKRITGGSQMFNTPALGTDPLMDFCGLLLLFLMIPGGYFLDTFQVPTGYCREESKNNLASISFSKMPRGLFCSLRVHPDTH
jgi:hypothetical protein